MQHPTFGINFLDHSVRSIRSVCLTLTILCILDRYSNLHFCIPPVVLSHTDFPSRLVIVTFHNLLYTVPIGYCYQVWLHLRPQLTLDGSRRHCVCNRIGGSLPPPFTSGPFHLASRRQAVYWAQRQHVAF